MPSSTRFSLTAQIYLAVTVLALALVATSTVAWLDASTQARTRYEREIDDGLDVFKSDFDRASRDLNALSGWLAARKSIADFVRTRDSAGLTRYLEPWTEVSIADSIVVSDKNGNVIAELGPGQPRGIGSGHDLLGIEDALVGKKSSGVEQNSSGRLQRRITLPVYSTESSSPIGAIQLSFYLDGSFLQYRSHKPDQEIAIIYNDRIVVLTLTDAQGKPWQSGMAPAATLNVQREGKPSNFFEVNTEIGPELFKFKPLESPSGSNTVVYGIGVSLAAIDRERASVFRTFWLGLAVITAGAGIAAFLFVRALTAPIRLLDRAAQKIALGDLSGKIALARNDELGDLARQMDTMRQQLRSAFESATSEKTRYAEMIQSMGAAAVITDQQLKIVAVNTAAQALLHNDQPSLIGQPWQNVFGNGKDGQTPAFWNHGQAELGGQQSMVLRGRFSLRTNSQALLDIISTPIQVNGESAGYVHILNDAATEEQFVHAKDEFLMNAAHEMRGPLAALRASVELLREDYAEMSKPDLGLMIKTMQRSIIKFQGLVENLVDIGNIQVGRFRVRPVPTHLNDLFDDAISQVQPILQARNQPLEPKMDCEPSSLVYADRPRIVQVLINLLTNASKYGPENEAIDLKGMRLGERVMIEVKDRGQGILEEEQKHLFERFYRGRRAEEEGIGIGLGLALANEIVTAHGEKIGVRSEIGQGTTLWFTLMLTKE